MFARNPAAYALLSLLVCLHVVQAEEKPLSPAVSANLTQARQLLGKGELHSAIILLEAQLAASQGNSQYLDVTIEAYQQLFTRYQSEGKLPQAAGVMNKIHKLRPNAAVSETAITTARVPPEQPMPSKPSHLDAAERAFAAGQFMSACECYAQAEAQGLPLNATLKEKYAYCKLRKVAEQLNAMQGQAGSQRQEMEREVRAALELAPRLEFGNELLRRLTVKPGPITTAIKHLPEKDQGWSVCETAHFRIYHLDAQVAEQVAQIAEVTRAAVIRKWLGTDAGWQQRCQIYVHATADSYHRSTGASATAPGHSDYDADKNDASVIHYRRVFLRADHPHMLTAILPHEVTHVILNGQVGRKLLPRWADEGMAVLSEPYARIEMHLEPLSQAYRDGKALSVQELLSVQDYPADRSKIACFYGQSVCLVEMLTNLKGPQAFVTFMRDANRHGETVALERHYGLSVQQLDATLQDWIVAKKMPTLYRLAGR
jgi:tetratricopeptide (TPR) repeat protein